MSDMGKILGVLSGMVVGILLVFVLMKATKTNGRLKCEYDERQELVKGKGYKISFFILYFYMMAYGLLEVMEIKVPMDNFVVMMLGVSVTMAVQIMYRIRNEAYVSMNENPVRLVVAFSLIGLVNIALGVLNIIHGDAIVDGVLTFRCVNLIVGVLCIFVSAVVLAKHKAEAKEEEEE